MKDDDENKTGLKGLDEFKPEEAFKLFDFQKERERIEDDEDDEEDQPTLKTKFCFKHKEDIINFNLEPCGKDSFDVVFVVSQKVDLPFIQGWMKRPILNEHVELNKMEKFLNKIGFGFTLEKKIETVAQELKERIQTHLKQVEEAKEISKKFKL